MSDDVLLLALLAFLYVTDSYYLLHKQSVAFRKGFGGRCRVVFPSANAGNRDRALHLYGLLPPFRPTYRSCLLPVSLSGRGVLAFVSQTFGSTGPPGQSRRVAEFGTMRSVKARGRELVIDGTAFVGCRTPAHAALLAATIAKMARRPGRDADALIRRAVGSTFNVSHARRILDDYEARSAVLRASCTAVFLALFLLFPLLCRWKGLGISLAVTLAMTYMTLIVLCISFVSLHRRYHPASRPSRIGCVARFLLCPPCAIRANDLVAGELLARFHPVAVARVLCPKAQALDFIRRTLRDLRYSPRCEAGDEPAAEIEAAWRERMIRAVEGVALGMGAGLADLRDAPWKADPSMTAYCPRCLSQFSSPPEACPDCAGVLPVTFSPPPSAPAV